MDAASKYYAPPVEKLARFVNAPPRMDRMVSLYLYGTRACALEFMELYDFLFFWRREEKGEILSSSSCVNGYT